MHMRTDIIEHTTWAEASAPRKTLVRVRPFTVARPRGVFLTAELALLGVTALEALWQNTTFEVPILIGFCSVAFYLKALDRAIVHSDTSRFWRELSEALCWGTMAGMLLLYAFPTLGSRIAAAAAGLAIAALLPVALRPVLRHLITHKKLVEETVIVGNGQLAERFHEALAAGNLTSEREPANGILRFPDSLTESGGLIDFSRLPDILLQDRISRVIVAEQDAQNRSKLAAALLAPRLGGLLVNDAVDYYERLFGKIWIDSLSSEWFVYTGGFKQSRVGVFLKRCFDIAFALLLFVLTAPFVLLIAIAIKLDSAGPALFRQVRVGLHGKTFVIYKFRSMRQDAEHHGGPVWAAERDHRITRVGQLLRKFRIDEIPQAINVLRGEMSWVGPRPERPYFVDRLAQEIPFYNLRHCVKPGITGWAQVKYRYGASVEDAIEKLQYDLYYTKHRSFVCDIVILLKTVRIVLFGRGR